MLASYLDFFTVVLYLVGNISKRLSTFLVAGILFMIERKREGEREIHVIYLYHNTERRMIVEDILKIEQIG